MLLPMDIPNPGLMALTRAYVASRPQASVVHMKRSVRMSNTEYLTCFRLESKGRDAACSICRDILRPGLEIFVTPDRLSHHIPADKVLFEHPKLLLP